MDLLSRGEGGDYVFVSGLTATDENGNLLHKEDIVAQARAICRKIEGILRHVGAGLNRVPDAPYKETAEARWEMFGDRFLTAMGIPVQSLIRKDALIEIKVVANVPSDRR